MVEKNAEINLSQIAEFSRAGFTFLKNRAIGSNDPEMTEMVKSLEHVMQSLILGTMEMAGKLADVNLVGEGNHISLRRKSKPDMKTQN